MIEENKEKIILAGLIFGILSVLEFLPKSIDTFGLEENIRYFYLAVMVIAVFLFHSNYWSSSALNYQRTVAPRTLGNPRHMAHRPQMQGAPPPNIPRNSNMRTDGVWERFRKE